MNHPVANRPFHRSRLTIRAAACCALALTATLTQASAGEADGVYRIKRISTSDSLPVPKDLIANAVASNNRITVRDNKITIQRENWLDVLNHFNFAFFGGTATFSGPKSLTLEPSGDSFSGKTTRPVVVRLTGSLLGTEIKMDLRTTCRAKLIGNQLVLTLPVRIRTDGEVNSTGTVRVVARR